MTDKMIITRDKLSPRTMYATNDQRINSNILSCPYWKQPINSAFKGRLYLAAIQFICVSKGPTDRFTEPPDTRYTRNHESKNPAFTDSEVVKISRNSIRFISSLLLRMNSLKELYPGGLPLAC